MGSSFCLIMATILAATRANALMGVLRSHVGVRSGVKRDRVPRGVSSYLRHGHGQTLATSRLAFATSSSSPARRGDGPRLPTATGAMSPFARASGGRRAPFHATALHMAAAKRKKNGGKTKRTAPKVSKRRTKREGDALPELEEVGEEADPEAAPFAATFASVYHAPVMPKECIDALLQQGEWGDMLRVRQERRRKKQSILEAKRRRTGYYDDDEGEDDADGGAEAKVPGTGETLPTPEEATEDPPRLFVDGTLGGGGHSEALLRQLRAGDVLVSCDVDPAALATASTRLKEYLATRDYILDQNHETEEPQSECEWEQGRPMFVPVQANFRDLVAVLSKIRHPVTGHLLLGERERDALDTDHVEGGEPVEFAAGVDGLLLDLGVSSHQIDTSERGFAFMKEGPLDMRMSGNGNAGSASTLTAADICNEFDEATIIEILRTYGDEPRAKRIVAAIVAARPLRSTTDLVTAINSVTPTFARQKRAGLIATSARVFQALRIVVNEEDGALKEVLEGVAPWALSRGGSGGGGGSVGLLVVLSYHSMEDKMAKRVIRDGKIDLLDGSSRRRGGGVLERDLYGNVIGGEGTDCQVPFEPLTKPRKATEEEVDANSRSRSATLRVAIRI